MVLIRTSTESWNAEYTVQGNRDAQIVRIKSRSSITVVIAKIMENLPLSRQNGYVLHIRAELRHSPPGNRELE